MDPVRFDALAKTLSTARTRRGLLRLLTVVPVAGGVLSLLDEDGVAANGHHGHHGRHGDKGRSRDGTGGKGRDRQTTSVCVSESQPATCRGRCGTVRNNCGVRVACGSCCGSDDDCGDGAFCDRSDRCVAKKHQGAACGREGECLSGFCEQGFCCNMACNTENCHACDIPGFTGQCENVEDHGFFCF
jgi:hypothetical protein